jgi:hypothetical protein
MGLNAWRPPSLQRLLVLSALPSCTRPFFVVGSATQGASPSAQLVYENKSLILDSHPATTRSTHFSASTGESPFLPAARALAGEFMEHPGRASCAQQETSGIVGNRKLHQMLTLQGAAKPLSRPLAQLANQHKTSPAR